VGKAGAITLASLVRASHPGGLEKTNRGYMRTGAWVWRKQHLHCCMRPLLLVGCWAVGRKRREGRGVSCELAGRAGVLLGRRMGREAMSGGKGAWGGVAERSRRGAWPRWARERLDRCRPRGGEEEKKGKLGFFVVFPFCYLMFLFYFLLPQIEFLIKCILHKLTHQTK
jgi:hypothetical protein